MGKRPFHWLDCTCRGAAENVVREGILRLLPFFVSDSQFMILSFFAYLSSFLCFFLQLFILFFLSFPNSVSLCLSSYLSSFHTFTIL
jgi:hypothetical protein